MSQFNKHYQRFQLPQMNLQQKSRKQTKIINETADVYLQSRSKNRYSVHNAPLRNRNNYDTLKTVSRKSIQANNPKNATIQANQRQYYKRQPNNMRKQSNNRRYEEEQLRGSSKSPYLKKEFPQGRTASLNRSTHKIKSSSVVKNSGDFYRQPKSSFSQHYDPNQSNLHKRRVSMAVDDRNYTLEQAKEYYKNNQFDKSIEILKKYVKLNRASAEAHYFLGMSLINNNQFSLGIQELLQTLKIQPQYKKSLYLVIALAFKKLNKIDDSIEILTRGLQNFPQYYDCLVYRGKMYLKGQNYECAKADFMDAIQLNRKKGFAYLGKGTAQKELGQIPEAIESFTLGLTTDMKQNCLQKRGLCYYEMGKFDLAIRDLQSCSQGYGTSLHFVKGLIYYKLRKPMEAILSFQQCLKSDLNEENITLSIEMMMRIKVEDKDFYEAYHILNRTLNIDIKKDIIEEWRLFLEGTLFMMKKKYKDGINTYKSLLSLPLYSKKYSTIKDKREKERFQFLKPLIHLYKAFGQISEGNKQNAKDDYKAFDLLCKEFRVNNDNLSKKYNSLIIQASERFPYNCLKLFEEAVSIIPSKPQPYLYLSFQKVQNSLEKEPDEKQQNIQYIIKNLTQGISHLPQLSNNHISTFYYYRSIIYLYKNDFNKAVGDIDKAIEKSQDNIPKYFYLRGLIFAIFGNFSQSIQDLSVSISLDEKYAQPYLQRAKCLQIDGNSNEAFLDLQKYITLSPDDPYIHKYAGFLLFQNCAYEDCLSAFSHGSDDINDAQMILTKAKCHFLLNNTSLCLDLFKKYQEQSYSMQYSRDIEMITICSSIHSETSSDDYFLFVDRLRQLFKEIKNEEQDCKIFKLRDIHQIQGSIWLLLGHFEKGLEQFEETLNLFRLQKKREMEKQFIEDQEEFQNEWSQIQIKFNISLCHACMKNYQKAKQVILEFEKSSERGKNWDNYVAILTEIQQGKLSVSKKIQLDTFQQHHRISKSWPKMKLPGYEVFISMAFSYPFVQPPEMLPQFDSNLFLQFNMSKVQNKPEAPWINRYDKGLIFTPNIQVFENLQLSITTKNNNGNNYENSEKNKPVSEIDHSVDLSNSDYQMQATALKQKFKLDSLVEMRLNKLMKKKENE